MYRWTLFTLLVSASTAAAQPDRFTVDDRSGKRIATVTGKAIEDRDDRTV